MSQSNFNSINRHITSTFIFIKKNNVLKSMLIFLFFICFGNSVLGQKNYEKYYYDNGNISSEGTMENGRPNEYWKTYYPNGQLKSEGNRENFKLDSTWYFYAEQGDTVSAIDYKAGKKHGKVISYRNNVRYEVSHYKDNVKVDRSFIYYPTGEIKQVIPYDEGLESGSGYVYDRSGRIITLLEYEEGYLRSSKKVNRFTDQGKKRGTWVEFHPNGVLAMEGYYMNGKRNGIFKTYDKKGDLLSLEKYRDDQLVMDTEESVILDIRNTYYPDGSVKSSGGYVEGKKEGTHRIYDKDGEVIAGEVYKRGEKIAEGIVDENGDYQGHWQLYYTDGNLRAEGDYKNSMRTGDWIFYFPNGAVESKGKYVEGLPQGRWSWFYPNGDKRRNEFYRRGEEDGEVTEWDIDGNVISKGSYISGYKDGEWYYHVGDHTEKGKYVDGQRQGTWIYEYEDGSLNYEGEYVAGLAVGKHQWYYPNGQIRKEGKYSSGIRVGTWNTYNPEGIKILEIKYKQGREFKINGRKVLTAEDREETKTP